MNDHIPDVTKMINDGGPAFPHKRQIRCNGEVIDSEMESGISMRDYFAGKALPQVDQRSHGNPDEIALECYQLADAMLKARGCK